MGANSGGYWKQWVRLLRPDGTVKVYGPFWYQWYRNEQGKRCKRYHGKRDPRQLGGAQPQDEDVSSLPFEGREDGEEEQQEVSE